MWATSATRGRNAHGARSQGRMAGHRSPRGDAPAPPSNCCSSVALWGIWNHLVSEHPPARLAVADTLLVARCGRGTTSSTARVEPRPLRRPATTVSRGSAVRARWRPPVRSRCGLARHRTCSEVDLDFDGTRTASELDLVGWAQPIGAPDLGVRVRDRTTPPPTTLAPGRGGTPSAGLQARCPHPPTGDVPGMPQRAMAQVRSRTMDIAPAPVFVHRTEI